MSRLKILVLMLFSALAAGAIVLLLAPRREGRGVLVDAQGRRHEIVSKQAAPHFAREILAKYRQWREADASGDSPQEKLRRAYALLLGAAGLGVLAISLAKRARPS